VQRDQAEHRIELLESQIIEPQPNFSLETANLKKESTIETISTSMQTDEHFEHNHAEKNQQIEKSVQTEQIQQTNTNTQTQKIEQNCAGVQTEISKQKSIPIQTEKIQQNFVATQTKFEKQTKENVNVKTQTQVKKTEVQTESFIVEEICGNENNQLHQGKEFVKIKDFQCLKSFTDQLAIQLKNSENSKSIEMNKLKERIETLEIAAQVTIKL
jgi:hypothetical protein